VAQQGETLAGRMAELARGFRDYLAGQTGVEIDDPAAIRPDGVSSAIARLDLALAQLADLAGIYSDDARPALEPLVMPVTALAGEYLRHATSAGWVEPEPDVPMDQLLIRLASGATIDIFAIARRAMAGGSPTLAAALQAVLEP
jgi:hypothetical protein